ncbi:MAG: stage II sporulation protein P [Oscillospiraceae bacterium]|nr:stage II sporulation protein P [Oscillospiraceae bacterium]
MTIQRRPRPQRRRQITAVLAAGIVLYLTAATATSSSARAALETLGQRGDLALNLLRSQLGDWQTDSTLPAPVVMAIGQSPVLLAGQEAVLELRSTEESDTTESTGSPESVSEPPEPDVPIPEEPAEPETPLLFKDNGVTAKTLVPTSSEGYTVAGDVYINNRTDYGLDPSMFDGTFAAGLSQEEGPKVLIVHTHGSESYTMPPGEEYVPSGDCRTTDCAYNVVRVGDELAKTLVDAGISVIHDATLHDYPEYSGAYDRSLETVKAYMAEYPSISFVLDVHRDAIAASDGSMYKVVSAADGMNAAQMSFVIGTDGGGLEHPHWRENLKLAVVIQQHLADQYPTLMRPVTVRNSRYNQHTTPGSLLVEMGAAGNSLDEALLSARLLGKAIVEVLLEK